MDRAEYEELLAGARTRVARELGGASLDSRRAAARLVGILVVLAQESFPGADPLPVVERLYVDLYIERTGKPRDVARQSWVSASGTAFQEYVRLELNNQLAAEGIRAVSVSELGKYPGDLRAFLMLPARRRCIQRSFEAWPDNDIMLLTKSQQQGEKEERVVVFGILSCKTSFHARETESCFWALATRDTGVRMGLVTQDRHLELGSCQAPTKARMLLEAYFDRVFSENRETKHCGQIRPFEELFDETRRWRRDVAPDFVGDPWPL